MHLEAERLALLAKAERARLEEEFKRLVAEARSKAQEAAVRRAEVQVTLNMGLLRHMAALGPGEVVRWALESSIITFDEGAGYDLGSVLSQVFSAVKSAFPEVNEARPKSRDSRPSSRGERAARGMGAQDKGNDRCVKVSEWDFSGTPHYPPLSTYPSRWGESAMWALKGGGVGSSVAVERADTCIKLMMTSTAKAEATSTVTVDVVSPITHTNKAEVTFQLKTVISVMFEGEKEEGELAPIITPASGVVLKPTGFRQMQVSAGDEPGGDDLLRRRQDFKFRFKNATVLIEPPQMTEPEPEPEPELVRDGEDADVLAEPEVEPLPPPLPPSPQKVLVEFVAPDFSFQARAIQRAFRAYYARRQAALSVISAWLRRRRVLAVWYDLLDDVWERAQEAAVAIQRIVRGALGHRMLERRRDEVIVRLAKACARDTSRLLDDVRCYKAFLSDESRNWRAFGLTPPPGIPYDGREEPGTTAAKHIQGKGGVGGRKKGKTAVRSVDTCGTLVSRADKRPDVALLSECLRTMQLPEAPPGTVLPMQDLCASSYVEVPQPWNVYSSKTLSLQDSGEKGEGVGEGNEDVQAVDPAVHLPCLYKKIAQSVKLF